MRVVGYVRRHSGGVVHGATCVRRCGGRGDSGDGVRCVLMGARGADQGGGQGEGAGVQDGADAGESGGVAVRGHVAELSGWCADGEDVRAGVTLI